MEFLSQPALKGRKPGSLGSRAARQYIESRFKAAGLVPWVENKDYTQSFGYGKNVVGVLPGSDTNLANEIVLVSAHYDHLGKDSKGRICPGAADNASGVAALLEIARQLSAQQHRPRRSVAFVAFDCEEMMLLGSFAFTCRKDMRDAKIVAVVNADMLGRNLLDVVTNTLFVAGTEGCPILGEQVCRFGTNAGIRVLRLGTDLVGPRSDHVVFQSRGIPCLFFSCGTCKDYHLPTDTADKLDFAALKRSAFVMQAMVSELANSAPESSCFSGAQDATSAAANREELRSVCTLLNEVGEHREQAGIKKEDAESFQKLALEAQKLLNAGGYDWQARTRLIVDATGILVPYFMPNEPGHTASTDTQMRLALQYVQAIYLINGAQLMEGYRGLVEQLLRFRPGPIHGMPAYEFEVYDIPNDGVSFRTNADGKCVLNAIINRFVIKAEVKPTKWLLKGFRAEMNGSYEGIDCDGSREQVLDCCLLRMRGEKRNASHFAKLQKVWERIGGEPGARDYPTLLAARLKAGESETNWLAACILSGNAELALSAIDAAGTIKAPEIRNALTSVIRDTKARPDVRAAAIASVRSERNQDEVAALRDIVGDSTPAYQREYEPIFRDDYPFSQRVEIKTLRPIFDQMIKDSPTASKTVGELARMQLKKLGVPVMAGK